MKTMNTERKAAKFYGSHFQGAEDLKLSADQIKSILDNLVPKIAEPKDHAVFRFALTVMAEDCSSSHFGAFVAKLLKGEAKVSL